MRRLVLFALAGTLAACSLDSTGPNGSVAGKYTLRKINGVWKAWDVVIDGISYVKSYREDYGAEVQQKGLDAVIARLEAKAASAKSAKVKTG